MSDSEASPASDSGTHSESEHSQHDSDTEVKNDTDDEDAAQQDVQGAEETTAKVRKPRISVKLISVKLRISVKLFFYQLCCSDTTTLRTMSITYVFTSRLSLLTVSILTFSLFQVHLVFSWRFPVC